MSHLGHPGLHPATISNPPSLGVVRIDALSAALEKLGLKVHIDAVLDAINQIEEERSTNAPSAAAKRAALVKLIQEMPSESPPSGKSTLSYTSTFVPKSSPSVDPKSKERRDRLRAMTKEAFPPGKPLPDPYTSVWLTARSDDSAVNKLPFITATCTVKPLDDDSDTPPSNIFSDVLCLWDTGAQTSYVLSSLLSSEVRQGGESGTALMDIKCEFISVL